MASPPEKKKPLSGKTVDEEAATPFCLFYLPWIYLPNLINILIKISYRINVYINLKYKYIVPLNDERFDFEIPFSWIKIHLNFLEEFLIDWPSLLKRGKRAHFSTFK